MLELLKKLLLDVIASPVTWSLLIGAVMAVIHSLAKSKAALVDAILSKAVDVAYNVVSEIAPHTTTHVDDQIVVFLKAFKDYFESHGLVVTPAVEATALAKFKELAGTPAVPEVK